MMTRYQKSATLYKFKKRKKFLIHSVSTIDMGAGIASEPYIWMEEAAGLDNIVEQILFALNNSKSGLPNPSSWAAFGREFLKSAGLKSSKELHDNVASVGILEVNEKLIFTPTANLGFRKGFTNVTKEKTEVDLRKGTAAVVLALEEALSKCE
jgi:hypothetical protein